MSRILVDQIRSNSASADAMTLDGSGNVTFPANATCSGTATGFGGGKIVQVKSVSKLDAFTVSSLNAGQYIDVTGLNNLQITTTGSNKVLVFMTVHMGINTGGYNGFMRGIRTTSGSVTNLSYPSTTGTSYRASGGYLAGSNTGQSYITHPTSIIGFEDSPSAGTHQYGIQIGSTYNAAIYTGRPYGGEGTGYVHTPSGTITLYEVEV